jgi:hypothetical protein
MSEQLRRIQFVTTYYSWLQGLRFIPLGLLSLGLAVWMSLSSLESVQPKRHRPEVLLVVLGGLALSSALYKVLGAYYRRRFGVVQATPRTRQRMVRALMVSLVVGLVLGAMAQLSRMGPGPSKGVLFVTLLLCGLGIIWYWHWTGRVVHHYLPVAAGFVGLSLLEVLGASPVCDLLQRLPFTTDSRCAGVTLCSAWGLAVIALGVLDHRLLVRTLGKPPESEPEEVPE